MKFSTLAATLAALAPGALTKRTQMNDDFVPRLAHSIENTPAYDRFVDPNVKTIVVDGIQKREEEPSPDRNTTLQDGLIFVLHCTTPGFRDPCVVLGAPPGACVSFRGFDTENSTAFSNVYDNQVTSVSTSTGGHCQFYRYLNCNEKGDDRGLTVSYNYDLSWVRPGGDTRAPEYYRYLECNDKGDDRGVTISYQYDLSAVTPGYSGDYNRRISSWRC